MKLNNLLIETKLARINNTSDAHEQLEDVGDTLSKLSAYFKKDYRFKGFLPETTQAIKLISRLTNKMKSSLDDDIYDDRNVS